MHAFHERIFKGILFYFPCSQSTAFKLERSNVQVLPSIGTHGQLHPFTNGLIQSKLKDKFRLTLGPRNGTKKNERWVEIVFKPVSFQNNFFFFNSCRNGARQSRMSLTVGLYQLNTWTVHQTIMPLTVNITV